MNDEKNRFKLILLFSCAIHLSFILLFPTLGIPLEPFSEYLEVRLVELPPREIEKAAENKIVTPAKEAEKPAPSKVTLKPKKAAPEVKKETKTVAGEISPLKTSPLPAQKLPVLPPKVSKIETPLVNQNLQPTFGKDIGSLPRLQRETDMGQEERLLPAGEKTAKSEENFPEEVGFSPGKEAKAVFPVKEGLPHEGEGEELKEEEQVGIEISESLQKREPRIVTPPYPERAEKEGIEGKVKLKCGVYPNGMVSRVEIMVTSGQPELDKCAFQALMKWGFNTIKEEGIEWGEVTFIFELE